ncbi:hypothetical protein ASF03_21260 [Rhizobium sp. Leaf68]|nr:hypothetical protein ASE62_20715 [Rhizobium sp. Leaf202]KQN80453.1 hypothetical protein ASF03_21260 [Rhizobium sp. Leaf68]
MTKKALLPLADLKRLAAIAKSEVVVVSIEVDGRKFSVSPYTPNAPIESNDDELDRELAEFDKRNGYV